VEKLFRTDADYLLARDGAQMRQQLRNVLSDPQLSASLTQNGVETILTRHMCSHRVDQLLQIIDGLETARA